MKGGVEPTTLMSIFVDTNNPLANWSLKNSKVLQCNIHSSAVLKCYFDELNLFPFFATSFHRKIYLLLHCNYLIAITSYFADLDFTPRVFVLEPRDANAVVPLT